MNTKDAMSTNARVRLLRSTTQRLFFVGDLCLYSPTLYLLPSTCNPSLRLFSYEVSFLFSLPLVRRATTARSDEPSSSELAESTKGIDDLALRIALVLRKKAWCQSTENELQVFLPLSSSVLQAVLRQEIAIEPALSFLSWACKQPGFVLDADDVNGIAQGWALKYASFALADLQETLDASSSFYNDAAWTALMTMCTFLKKPDESARIFLDLKKHGCKPSQLLYDALLHALVKCQWIDVAFVAMQEMLASRIVPGGRALGVLLDASCQAGKVKDAYNLVQDSVRLGLVGYEELAYSRLITAVWRVDASMALGLFNEMKVKGLQPDKQAYMVCIKLLCRNDRFDLAQILLVDMGSPDMVTYNTIITGLQKSGRVKEALDVIKLVRKGGHPLDSRMFTAFLSCLFKVGQADDAIREFEKMQREGHVVDLATYSVVIRNLCDNGDVKRALHSKNVMNEKGLQPDAEIYQALQRGLCLTSCYVDELLHLMDEMKSKGIAPSAEVYLTLVTHFFSLSKHDIARVWAKEMIDQGYKPTPYIRTRFPELFFGER